MIATKESFLFSTFHIFNTLFIESSASTLENLNFSKTKWIGDFSATVTIQILKAGKLHSMMQDLKRH